MKFVERADFAYRQTPSYVCFSALSFRRITLIFSEGNQASEKNKRSIKYYRLISEYKIH